MVASSEGYSGPQVCRLVGITYRQLDYWARTGLSTPTLAAAKGSGTKRRYDYTDVLELKVIKSLIDAGVSLQRARRAVDCLRDRPRTGPRRDEPRAHRGGLRARALRR